MTATFTIVADGDIPTTKILGQVINFPGPVVARKILIDEIQPADASATPLLFSRVCDPKYAWLPDWLKKAGARYAYYLDDNLWEYNAANHVAKHYARSDVQTCLNRFVANAAFVIVNSRQLGNEISRRFPGVEVVLLPAPMDFSRIDMSVRPSPLGPLRVGYAGSDRGEAFDEVAKAIDSLLSTHPGMFEFEFIGSPPPAPLKGKVKHFAALESYDEFIEFKQSRGWNVGLAPLQDDSFSRCKTNNKYREYGALSIAGIYSAVLPYSDCVSHLNDGLLVPNTQLEWKKALLFLASDRPFCAKLGDAARQNVQDRHGLQEVAPIWRSKLLALPLRTASLNPIRYSRWFAHLAGYLLLRDLRQAVNLYREGGVRILVQSGVRRLLRWTKVSH